MIKLGTKNVNVLKLCIPVNTANSVPFSCVAEPLLQLLDLGSHGLVHNQEKARQ